MRHGAAARLQAARRGKGTRHALRAHAEAAELAPCVEVPNPNPNPNPDPWLERPKPKPKPKPDPHPKPNPNHDPYPNRNPNPNPNPNHVEVCLWLERPPLDAAEALSTS